MDSYEFLCKGIKKKVCAAIAQTRLVGFSDKIGSPSDHFGSLSDRIGRLLSCFSELRGRHTEVQTEAVAEVFMTAKPAFGCNLHNAHIRLFDK